MPDIFLIQPPIRDFYLTAKRTIPYGLASIAGALEENGFSVEIFDSLATSKSRTIRPPEEMGYLHRYYGRNDLSPFRLFHQYRQFGYDFRQIGEKAKASGAFLVGISALFTPYIGEALETAKIVKAFHPDCKIVLGGHHPTVLPESVINDDAVDFVLRGEGEVSMPKLGAAIKNGSTFHAVPGIVYRNGNGSLTLNRPAFMNHGNRFPLPATHLLDQNHYSRKRKNSAVVVTSRGCPMHCSYCSVNASSPYPYRRRGVDDVLEEIETLVNEYETGFVDFEDENLSLDRKWFLKLLKEIKQRFHQHGLELRAMNGLYPPTIDEDVVDEMKQAGFKTLNLSLGSISSAQLQRFQRSCVRDAFDHALCLAETQGMDAVGYVIAGAPNQTAEDSVVDLLFLAQRRVLAGVSIFYPSPGSADFTLCEKLHLLPAGFSLMRSSALPISHSTSRKEAVTILRLGRILNFMKFILDSGKRLPAPEPIQTNRLDKKDLKDRTEIGKKLLQWFLFDGKIRGIEPSGEIYEHAISASVTRQFIEGLKEIKIRGVRT